VTRLRGSLLLAGALAWNLASAHRLPESLTTVDWNPASGTLEIIHRLHSHDAELALAQLLEEPGISLLDLRGRAQLALYVEKRFHMALLEDGRLGTLLALTMVGVELQGDTVLIYQEFEGALPGPMALRNDVLRDVYPDQVNQVNIDLGAGVRTLFFRGEDSWQIP